MDLKTIILLVAILTSINIVFVGLGLFTEADLSRMSILDSSTTELINTGQTTTNDVDITTNTSGADSYDQLSSVDSTSYAAKYSTIKVLVLGLLIGYVAILNTIGLPMLLVYLITSLIGIFQIFAVFYIIAYFVSTLRGNGALWLAYLQPEFLLKSSQI